MLILTLSSYNSNDDNLDDLQGVFPDRKAVVDFILNYGDSDCAVFESCEDDGEGRKPGLKLTHISKGYIDNGWGGRYYKIWSVEENHAT